MLENKYATNFRCYVEVFLVPTHGMESGSSAGTFPWDSRLGLVEVKVEGVVGDLASIRSHVGAVAVCCTITLSLI